jgi:hypothetical protein
MYCVLMYCVICLPRAQILTLFPNKMVGHWPFSYAELLKRGFMMKTRATEWQRTSLWRLQGIWSSANCQRTCPTIFVKSLSCSKSVWASYCNNSLAVVFLQENSWETIWWTSKWAKCPLLLCQILVNNRFVMSGGHHLQYGFCLLGLPSSNQAM